MEHTAHSWKDEILAKYQIRKTSEQKTAFIGYLKEIYGDRLHVEEAGKLLKSRNIVIGNPDTARTIYAAHYDTCTRLPFPNFITPKNIPVFVLYQLLLTVLIAAPILLISFGGTNFIASLDLPVGVSIVLSESILFLLLGAILWFMLAGPANPHTANDNTSGVVTVLMLADRLSGRDDLCFVLFDNEETGLFGSAAFAKAHKTVRDHTLLVNFDCVSDGDWLLFTSSKSVSRSPACEEFRESVRRRCASTDKLPLFASSSEAIYPSDQMNFKKSIAVAALKKTKTPLIGYYMDRIHTPKDTVFDDRNIEVLTDIFTDTDCSAL